jgi:hypothetical protein
MKHKHTTWVIIILVLVIVGAVVFRARVERFTSCMRVDHDFRMKEGITKGLVINLQNQWGRKNTYLDTRDSGCQDNALCVSASYSRDRQGRSGYWTMIPVNGRYPVQYGDVINLQNQWGKRNTYLDTRDSGCQDNALCVSASYSKDRQGGSGHWKVLSAEGKTGKVMIGDKIHLQNQWGDKNTYLDTKDSGCQGNALCVSASYSDNRDDGSGTWRIYDAPR